MPTAQACVVCECCVRGAPVLLGTLRCTRATGKTGGKEEGSRGEVEETVVMFVVGRSLLSLLLVILFSMCCVVM